ncbi:MAG: LptA/OstA family protein [Chthoniobacterales bacterium]
MMRRAVTIFGLVLLPAMAALAQFAEPPSGPIVPPSSQSAQPAQSTALTPVPQAAQQSGTTQPDQFAQPSGSPTATTTATPAVSPGSSFGSLGGLGSSFGDVEITSTGETRFEEGVAVAEDNVQIHSKDVSLYTDYAEYNPDTRDVLLKGNVRIYTSGNVITGQRAIYNLESKQVRALEFEGMQYPGFFHALGLRAPSEKEFRLHDVSLTTQDSSTPYWHVHARSMRIYRNDHTVLNGATIYIGKVPIFYIPYIFANLNTTGIDLMPGYDSRWGAFLLTAYSFPIGNPDNMIGKVRFDYRTLHGPAVGFDTLMKYGKNDRSGGNFIAYYAYDKNPGLNFGGNTGTTTTNTNRGRITFQQRLYLTDDIYATADINYLSDSNFLQDFYPAEFRTNPQPDNYVQLTKWHEFYTLNLLTRFQTNSFQDTVERLPEFAWDFKQTQLFQSPIYYDGNTTLGYYRNAFGTGSGLPSLADYSATRFDTFHQISYPRTYFGWLTVIPLAGIRGTYYSQSGSFLNSDGTTSDQPTNNIQQNGSVFRPVFNTGLETSFKMSRAFEHIQSRALGVDGVRHIMQPYTNFSYVYNAGTKPDQIYQFDPNVPSTQPQALEFPQFTGIDSLDTWAIVRTGVRNRLQTRRNNGTMTWLYDNTYIDYNFQNPYTNQKIGNLVNELAFYPVPWFGLQLDTQMPLTSDGFSEVNAGFSYLPVKDLSLRLGDQYIEGNPYFPNGNQITFSAYWHITDNWAVSMYEQYQAVENFFSYQRYMVHRDLSSWIASFGGEVRNNQGGPLEYGVVFTMTLKDAPQTILNGSFDQTPAGAGAGN